ncbi:MAG TPA: hypothetical protein VIJ85_01850 [Rhizomicrobium sp.]
MHMRVAAGAVFAVLISSGSSVLAGDAPPNPLAPVSSVLQAITGGTNGWTRNMDGSYRQAQTGVLCPTQFKTFHLDSLLASKDDTNVLGICRYSDGEGRVGTVRVRQPGPVVDPDGIVSANDKSLMATDGSAPPMLMRTGVDRKTGGSRLTVTIARNGYLVDCSVMQIEHNTPKGDFPLYCTTLSAAK